MSTSRLSLFFQDNPTLLADAGKIAVFGAHEGADLAALEKERVQLVCGRQPDFDRLRAAGFQVDTAAPAEADLAIVLLPRSKALARAMVAEAMALAGKVIVDGQKTDGVDGLWREMRKRGACSAAFSKAHGKVFVCESGDFGDWLGGAPMPMAEGFATAPGVFSADGVDPASALLAAALPVKLGRHVVDLGAGWGYLGARILERDGIERLDLVEADHAALCCARQNVSDTRAAFHWADATTWRPEQPVDAVVMNPPFHEGRKGVPELGQRFIAAAAAMLAPSGRLWMVANRHLPYEASLHQHFREVEESAGDARFKIFHAARPTRPRA